MLYAISENWRYDRFAKWRCKDFHMYDIINGQEQKRAKIYYQNWPWAFQLLGIDTDNISLASLQGSLDILLSICNWKNRG